jgi:Holliday junction resolvasome RuvABC ATP-dependent DNA helicase subunit
MSLTIFTEANGVYAGTNTPQFTQLEYLVTTATKTKTQIPSLGLFGEASTGKTSSAKLLAHAAGYRYLYFNASSLSLANFYKTISAPVIDMMVEKKDCKVRGRAFERVYVYESQTPFLILIDEAHDLSKDLQTLFLSLLDQKDVLNPNEEVNTISIKNVTFVFATTDSSKLLYPLTTRLFNITFDQYSTEDIMNIVRMKYKLISNGGLKIIAQCAKLVPRVALSYAEQLTNMHPDKPITEEQVEEFAKKALAMETNGIDAIDKRILLYLSNNKKKIAPVDEISLQAFRKVVARFEKKGIDKLSSSEHKEYNRTMFNVAMLEHKLNTAEYVAKSRQDISLACRVLDLGDLEKRLSYLEKLGFVTKTSKGISLVEKYL